MPDPDAKSRYCNTREALWTELAIRSMVSRNGVGHISRSTGLKPGTIVKIAGRRWSSIRYSTYEKIVAYVAEQAHAHNGETGTSRGGEDG